MNLLARIKTVAPCLMVLCLLATASAYAADGQWSPEKAQQWYQAQDWIVGANFSPSTAINQLEMWQADSFDPKTIDRELGYAAGIGFNCMRVYLHDMVWTDDAKGYYKRIDKYLAIADKHGIRTMFVLFDSVWDPHPALGKQREPKPGLHNSGWVQSPHIDILKNIERHKEVKPFVTGMLKRYGSDKRILMWDLYNEPGNNNVNSYGKWEPKDKETPGMAFLQSVYRWAREVRPDQPLTTGAWKFFAHPDDMNPLDQYSLQNSDVITFHTYETLDKAKKVIERLKAYGRPMICTEYMARTAGNTFEEMLPLFKKEHIGAINWGLVNGKSNTIYPWESWDNAFDAEPEIWFHDIFRPDGTPFDPADVVLIKSLTGAK